MQTTMIVLGLLIVAVGIIMFTAKAKMNNIPLVPDNEKVLTLTDKNFQQQTKNNLVLVDFWASWCLPCKKSLPYLINYYINNKDTNLVILAVNVDTDPANFKKFREKLDSDFPFIVVLDSDNKIVSKYNIESLPTTIFIDKKGNINKVSVGFTDDSKQEYTDELAKLLKE